MYELELVDRLDGHNDLGNVESRNVLAEDIVLDQHGHKIAARQEFHQHVQELVILERRKKLHDPWAVGFGQDVSLSPDSGSLVSCHHLRLDQ